MGTMWEHVEPT